MIHCVLLAPLRVVNDIVTQFSVVYIFGVQTY